MDNLDKALLLALHRNGRASLSELAAELKVTRSTVRARLERLKAEGEIVGFSVVTRRDLERRPVRGLMMLGIEGKGAEKIMRQLSTMPEIQEVHSTNGTWDLIAEIGTDTLERFDKVLFAIRKIDGVTRSETNLLLSSRRGRV